jgi:hypothetical protein
MELDQLARRFDEAYRSTAARFPQPSVRIEQVKNRAGVAQDTLILTGLDKVEEPESLRLLRHCVARRQPLVDLPELLLEIQARTGFASEFSHMSEGRSRLDDLPTSICAILLAEACNVGLTPLVRKGIPALSAIGCSMCSKITSGVIRFPAPMRGRWTIRHRFLWLRHGVVGKSPARMDCALSFP